MYYTVTVQQYPVSLLYSLNLASMKQQQYIMSYAVILLH